MPLCGSATFSDFCASCLSSRIPGKQQQTQSADGLKAHEQFVKNVPLFKAWQCHHSGFAVIDGWTGHCPESMVAALEQCDATGRFS